MADAAAKTPPGEGGASQGIGSELLDIPRYISRPSMSVVQPTQVGSIHQLSTKKRRPQKRASRHTEPVARDRNQLSRILPKSKRRLLDGLASVGCPQLAKSYSEAPRTPVTLWRDQARAAWSFDQEIRPYRQGRRFVLLARRPAVDTGSAQGRKRAMPNAVEFFGPGAFRHLSTKTPPQL
jgi:hypothetical protein